LKAKDNIIISSTCQNVSFVHEMSGEQDDSSLFARLQQRPQVAARVGVHPSSWLVQENDLEQQQNF
jgi:hypothetical protein